MSNKMQFSELIVRQGLAAAKAELESVLGPLLTERQDCENQMAVIDSRIRASKSAFEEALRELATQAGVDLSAKVPREDEYAKLSVEKVILTYLRNHGSQVKGHELYRFADDVLGKNRRTVWTTVSRLIREGRIEKGKLPGEPGSLLTLVEPETS